MNVKMRTEIPLQRAVYGLTLCLIIFGNYTLVSCLQEIVPAKVTIQNIKKWGESTSPALRVTVVTRGEKFRFKLTQCDDKKHPVPVYLPANRAGTIGVFKTKELDDDPTLYKDMRHRAWFYLHQSTNNTATRVTGVFSSLTYLYTIQPSRTSRTSPIEYSLLRQESTLPGYPVNGGNHTTGIEDLPAINVPFRKVDKREVILYEIELFAVVDFSVYKEWIVDRPDLGTDDNDTGVINDITTHYTLLVHGMNSRFQAVRGPDYTLNLLLVGIYVAYTPAASPWIHNTSYHSHESTRPVMTSDALYLFLDWLDLHTAVLPNFDHAMAFTANNLAHKENLYTLGVASQQSMCTDRSLSIIEDHGNIAYASFVASHELAHSLGAKHDGSPSTVRYEGRSETCEGDDGYIMSPVANSKPKSEYADRSWTFSPCSQLYFRFYIDHLYSVNNNCLLYTPSVDQGTVIQELPVSYTPDQQCARVHGVTASRDPNDVCRSIPCTKPGTPRDGIVNTLSMEGTACGVGMSCRRGACVQNDGHTAGQPDIQLVSGSCIFGDQPGTINNTSKTCAELTDKPYNCYQYGIVCCSSCRQHLRLQPLFSNCSYGDRIANCDRTMCGNGDCCETCAVYSGSYTTCPSIDARPHLVSYPHTEFHHDGAVLTFSCQTGYNLDGSREITCTGNGSWSDDIPTCYRGCPKFAGRPELMVTLTNGNYSFGSLAHFRCLHSFVLVGGGTALCLDTSYWNSSVPTCVLQFTSEDTVRVPENIPTGQVILKLSAGDGRVHFEMIGVSQPGFIVQSDGIIAVDSSIGIDYEHVQEYRLRVKATSDVDQSFTATQVITVHIDDVNEYEPVFEQREFTITVPRDITPGQAIRRFTAEDGDLSTVALTYTLTESTSNVPRDMFTFDVNSGTISLKPNNSLGEPTRGYNFVITATDDGLPESKTGTTAVVICVERECNGQASLSTNTSLFIVLVMHVRVLKP